MTKVLDILLTTPLSLIDKKLGQQVSGIGLTVLGTLSGNPLLTALGSYQLSRGFGPTLPKPEQTEQAVRSPIPVRVSGYGIQRLQQSYMLFVTSTDGFAVDVGAYHAGRVDSIIGYYLGDTKVTINGSGFVDEGEDGLFGSNHDTVQIGTTLGPFPNVAFAPVIAKVPEVWSVDHRGDGIATAFVIWKPVKTKNYAKVYAGGGPDQKPLSLVMKLQPVYDWRDETQDLDDPLTWKWSANACLHYAHYLLVRDNKTWARHFAPTLAYWTAAADDCDVAMPLKAGGTEPRYRGCVVHKHTDEHKAVKGALLSCFDGWESPRADGALVVYSGHYVAPVVTVDDRDVISYSVQDGIEEEAAVNTIPLTYVSAEHDYTTVDTDPWVDADDIERRGKELASSGIANQVPSASQARRLGKRAYAEAMAAKRGNCTLRSTGRKILGQRYIRLVLPEIGFDETVQVKAPVKRDPTTGQVSFTWILADPSVDDWDPETEESDPTPVADPIVVEPLEPPVIISATAQFSAVGQTPEGDEEIDPTPGQTATGARILIASTGPDREDLTWFARWRVGTSGSWLEREFPDSDPGPGVSFLTESVTLAPNINVETAYTTGDGRQSPWSDPVVVDTRAP